MTERNGPIHENETPEDVAMLYSWANLSGARYRDFSASRAENRELGRRRLQQAAQQQQHARQQSELAGQSVAEKIAPPIAAQANPMPEVVSATERTGEDSWQAPRSERLLAHFAPIFGSSNASQAPISFVPAKFEPGKYESIQYESVKFETAQSASTAQSTPPPAYRPGEASEMNRPKAEERIDTSLDRSHQGRESAAKDGMVRHESEAWMESATPPDRRAAAKSAKDSWGTQDCITHRWFALKGIYGEAGAVSDALAAPDALRAPAVGVFSLAGGVGKTTLLATLGRALAAQGERVLLVDTTAYGLLPFFFGASDQRPGHLRTFLPPPASAPTETRGDVPVQLVTIDPDFLGLNAAGGKNLSAEIARHACCSDRILIDLPTASGITARRVMRMAPVVLVPVIPDLASVISIGSIDAFFERQIAAGTSIRPHYVLNQFDASLPLHLDLREVLRERLGDRLLPFALSRSQAVSESLAEGMTVIDYAPNSAVAEEYRSLAWWVRSCAAARSTSLSGVRWSER